MSNLFDIQEDIAQDSSLTKLVAMAADAVATEQMVEELEQQLSDMKKNLNRIKTVDLPDAMAEAGLSELSLNNGFKITIDDFVSGSLPKDDERRRQAINWLEQNGADTLIKTDVNIQFDKSKHNEALNLMGMLEEHDIEFTSKSGVHPQTLLAHVKERLRKGDEVPLELLGLYAGRVAKIKAQKGKK